MQSSGARCCAAEGRKPGLATRALGPNVRFTAAMSSRGHPGFAVAVAKDAPRHVYLTFPVTSISLLVQENHLAIIQVVVRANDLEGSVSQRLDE